MKIPSRILQAPPGVLDENLIKAWEQIGFCIMPQWTDMGCAVFVYVDSRTIKDCRNAIHSVTLELHQVGDVPVIRLDVKVYDRLRDPFHADAFLNINNPEHIPAIEALAEQEQMIFHWYNEKMEYVRSSGIHWTETQQNTAREILKKARTMPGADFNRAKAEFMKKYPFSKGIKEEKQ